MISIRRAQAKDQPAVRDICERIWSDDYVPDVFDDWIRDRRGGFWVAIVEGQVVGFAKLSLVGRREAWLHALRVDPRYRRRGVATALLEHRLRRARRLGTRVARLDTADGNVAIERLMGRYHFRRVARLGGYAAPAITAARPRAARRSDVGAAWRLLRPKAPMLREAHFMRGLVRDDVVRAIRARSCFLIGPGEHPSAVALVTTMRESSGAHGHGQRLLTRAIAGTPSGVRELLRALRGEAKAQRLDHSGIVAPDRLWPAVRAAGYRRRWPETKLVYERRL